jgi:hypothetical protein
MLVFELPSYTNLMEEEESAQGFAWVANRE